MREEANMFGGHKTKFISDGITFSPSLLPRLLVPGEEDICGIGEHLLQCLPLCVIGQLCKQPRSRSVVIITATCTHNILHS